MMEWIEKFFSFVSLAPGFANELFMSPLGLGIFAAFLWKARGGASAILPMFAVVASAILLTFLYGVPGVPPLAKWQQTFLDGMYLGLNSEVLSRFKHLHLESVIVSQPAWSLAFNFFTLAMMPPNKSWVWRSVFVLGSYAVTLALSVAFAFILTLCFAPYLKSPPHDLWPAGDESMDRFETRVYHDYGEQLKLVLQFPLYGTTLGMLSWISGQAMIGFLLNGKNKPSFPIIVLNVICPATILLISIFAFAILAWWQALFWLAFMLAVYPPVLAFARADLLTDRSFLSFYRLGLVQVKGLITSLIHPARK